MQVDTYNSAMEAVQVPENEDVDDLCFIVYKRWAWEIITLEAKNCAGEGVF